MNSLLLAAVRIIMAMQTKYACFLTIAVMSLIIKLICFFIEQALVWIYTFTSFGVLLDCFLLLISKLISFFIEQALVWIYTFTSFGVLLVGFLLGIASTTALAVYNTFLWFFVLLACVFITFAAISVWLNPNDLRTGEYIRAISVSHMIAYFYF